MAKGRKTYNLEKDADGFTPVNVGKYNPIFTFEKPGDTIIGVYEGFREFTTRYKGKKIVNRVYELTTENGKRDIYGCTQIDLFFEHMKKGDTVRLRYIETKKMKGGRKFRLFDFGVKLGKANRK